MYPSHLVGQRDRQTLNLNHVFSALKSMERAPDPERMEMNLPCRLHVCLIYLWIQLPRMDKNKRMGRVGHSNFGLSKQVSVAKVGLTD